MTSEQNMKDNIIGYGSTENEWPDTRKQEDAGLVKKFMTTWAQWEHRYMPAYVWHSDPLSFWRERIIFILCFITVTFMPFVLIPSLFLSVYEGRWGIVLIDLVAYGTILFILYGRRFSIKIRAWLACLILYFLGVGLLLMIGFYGAGYIYLFGASVLTAAMLGFRASVWSLILNFLTLTAIACFIVYGSPDWAQPQENILEKWIVTSVNFLLLNILVTVTTAFMLKGLNNALINEQDTSNSLRQSERRFRLLAENVNDMIWLMDIEHQNITYISPSVKKIRGYTPEEVMEQPLEEILTPESYQMVMKVLADQLTEDEAKDPDRSITIETREYRKDGNIIWTEITASFVRDDERRPIAVLGVTRDISERKLAEEEKVQLEALLRQSQKMESIGTLAGGIAHEINNILGIIIGNTELALDDLPEWNPTKNFLKEIRTASLRAKDVVLQIMSFARKSPATREPVMIGTLIGEGMKLIRVTIPANIEIRKEILCDAEIILANPTELNQILVNLCSNSVDAIEEETGILEVRLEPVVISGLSAIKQQDLKAGKYTKLTVKDNGEGIAPEIMDRIFDPYFTTKDVDKGLGMGLAVVYGIVNKYDGTINAKSELGKGTSIEVLFPITDVQPKIETKEEGDLSTGRERILLVDDERSLVKTIKQMLERGGYEVVGKTSSKEALELFQKESHKFDLIITDMAMPEMPGDRLTREILKIHSSIPIILCTGQSNRIDEARATKLGITAFILKPLERNDLIKTVRRVLDTTKGKTQL